MQDKYVNMQAIYVNMQLIYGTMQPAFLFFDGIVATLNVKFFTLRVNDLPLLLYLILLIWRIKK